MAKGTHLTPEVKGLIAQTHLEHPDYGPTKVCAKLLKRMKKTGLDRNFGPDWPSVSAVGKVLTDIRKEESELGSDPQDRPWSVSALADYGIPPEVLPVAMKAWAKALENDNPLTIRQVKWIARLYYLLNDKDTALLTLIALEYASLEKVIKVTGTYPDKPQDSWWLWFNDAILYLLTRKDDRELPKFLKKEAWRSFIGPESITGESGPFRDYLLSKICLITVDEDSNQPEGQKKKGGTTI